MINLLFINPYKKKAVAYLLFYLLSPCILLAQDWESSYQKANQLLTTNDFEQAHIEALYCLTTYQENNGVANSNYASILRLLQITSYNLQNYEEGFEYAIKEIAIRESKPDVLLAGAYTQAGQFCKELGRYAEALDLLRLAKELMFQYYKSSDPQVIEIDILMGINQYLNDDDLYAYSTLSQVLTPVNSLLKDESALGLLYLGMVCLDRNKPLEAMSSLTGAANLYNELGQQGSLAYSLTLFYQGMANHVIRKYDNAETYFKQAQSLLENLNGTDSDVYLKILNERSNNLQFQGNSTLAKELLLSVRNSSDGLQIYAESISNRATVIQSQGDFSQALELYNESLGLFDKQTKDGLSKYATTLQNLGVLYSEMGDQQKAVEHLTESLGILKRLYGDSNPQVANNYMKAGLVHYRTLKFSDAKSDYNNACLVLESLLAPSKRDLAIAWSGLARSFQALGSYPEADSLYNKALGQFDQKSKGDVQYINTLYGLASLRQDMGRWPEAKQLIIKAKSILAHEPEIDSKHIAHALENAALINIRLGFTTEAKQQLDSAAVFFEAKGKESIDYAQFSLTTGRFYQMVGEYTLAESALRKANSVIQKVKGEQDLLFAQAKNALALLLQTMGNFLDAEPLFMSSLQIYERNIGKENQEYSTVLQNLATLYQLEEKYDQAGPLFKQALEIDRKVLGDKHPQINTSLQNLATYYQKTGNQKEALLLLENVVRNIERASGKNSIPYATAVSNLAAIHQDNKNFNEAEKFWKESVEIRKAVLGENHPDYARSQYGLAALYHATGKLVFAWAFYKPVISSYLRQVREFFPALSEKEKSAFYNKIKPAFDAYQDFCLEMIYKKPELSQEITEELFNLQLSTKAILLNASNKVRSRILNGNNSELKDLYSFWLQEKESIVKLANLTSEERKERGVDLDALEVKANEIEKQLSQKSVLFSSSREKVDLNWVDVQQALKPTEAAIEIIRIKKKFIPDSVVYVGLIVTPNSKPELIRWDYGLKMEGRFFLYHRNHIKFKQKDTISYRIFWQPLAGKLKDTQLLYMSCDGVFNKVNTAAILNPASGQWMLESKLVKRISSTRELVAANSPSSVVANNQISVFGYPDYSLSTSATTTANNRSISAYYGFSEGEIPSLPATETEVNLINQIFSTSSWKVKSYLRSQATEANVKSMESPGILHIATHGFFLSDIDINDELHNGEEAQVLKNPLFRSGLLLAGVTGGRGNSEEDGILTAYEAMNLNLDQTELVSLSACETGLGEVRNGEGVYGLQRAFSVAGAKAVLMSLWTVDDAATQELMTNFYSIWIKGKDKYVAFREAQLSLKQKYPEPYYWGAFILSGY